MAESEAIVFVCDSCGAQQPKWQGQCPDCGAWNTLSESRAPARERTRERQRSRRGRAHAARSARRRARSVASRRGSASSTACSAADSSPAASCCSAAIRASASRRCCCARSRTSPCARPRCYVTGEESLDQIALRASGSASAKRRSTCSPRRASSACSRRVGANRELGVLAIDSIQTLFSEELQSAPGSVSQVRECAGATRALCEGARRRDAADRSRDEGGHARGPARARAHGRHGALLRERRGQRVFGSCARRRIASAPRTNSASS